MNYVRGQPDDFDRWVAAGCRGWGYEDVLPHFKSIERFEGGDERYRGREGPMTVEPYRSILPITHRFVEAAQQAGAEAGGERIDDVRFRVMGLILRLGTAPHPPTVLVTHSDVIKVAMLALLGWAAAPGPLGARAALTFGSYALAIALFARTDNFYWALAAAPAYLIGMAFLPDAVRDLARPLLDRRRVRVQRITR